VLTDVNNYSVKKSNILYIQFKEIKHSSISHTKFVSLRNSSGKHNLTLYSNKIDGTVTRNVLKFFNSDQTLQFGLENWTLRRRDLESPEGQQMKTLRQFVGRFEKRSFT
jgi:hypothetical protein